MLKILALTLCLLSLLGGSADAVLFSSSPGAASVSGADDPGPSQALFNSPYYSCSTNYYVSTTGSDSNNGSSGSPWLTIAHAEGSGGAGVCINVEPGTYSAGAEITKGGTTAASTGYVVYRCTTLDGCTVTDPGNQGNPPTVNVHAAFAVAANYVILDGFVMKASSLNTFSEAVGVATSSSYTLAAHHVWVLNSSISNYGQSGIQLNQGSYFYSVHNLIYGNAMATNCDSGAQGSGISYTWGIPPSGYTPTAGDENNPVTGNTGTLFQDFVMWNVVHNNFISADCGAGKSTDGNGIVMDTMSWGCGLNNSGCQEPGASPYVAGALIANNVVYNNGGGGIHLTSAQYMTIANNSCYNNALDPNRSTGGNCIDTGDSYGDTVQGNLTYAVCGATAPQNGNAAIGPDGPNGAPYTETLGAAVTSTSQTTITLSADTDFPNTANFAFSGSYALPGGNEIKIGSELMRVTAGWGTTTLTVQRGYQGTTPATYSSGATVTWVTDYFSNNTTYATTGCSDVNGPYGGDVYLSTANKRATLPGWVNVGNSSTGTESTQPVATNFALQSTSAAIGYGTSEAWLPGTDGDAGACASSLATCP